MEDVGLVVAFSVIVLMDLVGNTMVILVILLNKSMRTPMNRLLLNLAVADMVVAIFTAIQFVLGPFYQHPSGSTGALLCKFITGGPMTWTAALVSICNLVAISYERYQAVVLPLAGRGEIPNRKLKFIIPSCWLAGFLWNIPLFVTVTYKEDLGDCREHWSGPVSPIAYSIGWDIVAGTMPITVMSYWYSKVVFHLWFDKTPRVKSAATKTIILQRKRATLVVISVSIIYATCWVPVLVMYTVTHSLPYGVMYSPLHKVTILIAMFNSCINPVVYSFTSARFRQHLLTLLRCKRTVRGQLAFYHTKQQEQPKVNF
ncbi:pyroglutamylated RFamide peptide receptor-like [Stylophora pistillata]|uniref:pyroglutamylated RFamide peptide receptor-like n=1 Tax=Stylophora pistillata TaxID=50429 RepID=UPI000C0517BD|nr:pyroglutamylated RFamide peptide receptor-like [Stylophora pistillata]